MSPTRIPSEILLTIASHQTYSEKKKLMKAIPGFTELVEGVLYEDFAIRGEKNFEAANSYFEKNKGRKNQVRRICLNNTQATVDDVLVLPKKHPLLRRVEWYHENGDKTNPRLVNVAEVAKLWENIDSLRENIPYSSYCLAKGILENGGFVNLTQLEVNFCYSSIGSNSDLLIEQLSKAPKLKILELKNTALDLCALEMLHCNAPQLETLYLIDIKIERTKDAPNVADSTSSISKLRTLVMQNIHYLWDETSDIWRAWMGHMSSKYKRLEHLTIDCASNNNPDVTDVAKFVAEFPNLKSYTVKTLLIEQSILKAMDESKVELKKIEIGGNSALQQLDDLLESNQRHSLEKIVISEKTEQKYFATTELYERLHKFENLKHLEITKSFGCELDTILTSLMKLETLKLEQWSEVELTYAYPKDGFRHPLKSLTLDSVGITNLRGDVMLYLSKACPDLSRLSIKGKFINRSIRIDDLKVKMEFPKHSFTSLTLEIEGFCYYKVKKQDQVRWLEVDGDRILEHSEENLTLHNKETAVSIVYEDCRNLTIREASPSKTDEKDYESDDSDNLGYPL